MKCISDLKYSKSEAQRLNTKETRQGTYIGSSSLNHFLTFYRLLKLKLVGQLGLVKHETLETWTIMKTKGYILQMSPDLATGRSPILQDNVIGLILL